MTYRETDSNEEIRKTVAVKIFPMQDKNSWQAEQEIYNLPRMDHESILKFIQCERRGENLAMEYWLTTEFHEYGNYNMFCRIFFSINLLPEKNHYLLHLFRLHYIIS